MQIYTGSSLRAVNSDHASISSSENMVPRHYS